MPNIETGNQILDESLRSLTKLLEGLAGPLELPAQADPKSNQKLKQIISPGALRAALLLNNDSAFEKIKTGIAPSAIAALEPMRVEVKTKLGHIFSDARVAPLIKELSELQDREPIEEKLGQPTRVAWEHALRWERDGRIEPYARMFVLHEKSVVADFTADWDDLVFTALAFLRCLDSQFANARPHVDKGNIIVSDRILERILERLGNLQAISAKLHTKFTAVKQAGGFRRMRDEVRSEKK